MKKNFFNAFFSNYREMNQEMSQAMARVIFTLMVLGYMGIFHYLDGDYSALTIYTLTGFLIYAAANLYYTKQYPGYSSKIKILNITADIGILSFTLYHNGQNAIFLYPLLLWMIVGHGMRFGMKYLFFALAVAEVTFTSALLFNEVWDDHRNLVYSLSFGLVVLSLFYVKMIQRMHRVNDLLEEKVADRIAEIEYGYLHDSLTGLKNRNAW